MPVVNRGPGFIGGDGYSAVCRMVWIQPADHIYIAFTFGGLVACLVKGLFCETAFGEKEQLAGIFDSVFVFVCMVNVDIAFECCGVAVLSLVDAVSA